MLSDFCWITVHACTVHHNSRNDVYTVYDVCRVDGDSRKPVNAVYGCRDKYIVVRYDIASCAYDNNMRAEQSRYQSRFANIKKWEVLSRA